MLANDDCDEALEILERLAHLDPPVLRVAPLAAQCHISKKNWAEALRALQVAKQQRGPQAQALTGFIQARSGNSAEAHRILADLLVRWNDRRQGAVHIAIVYAGLSEPDSAFKWLNQSIEDRSLNGLVMGPLFEELHHDRRFTRLLARVRISNR
ncbi:MAG: tetratricopeptide repeat protein [Longimicrobiales bacterium]